MRLSVRFGRTGAGCGPVPGIERHQPSPIATGSDSKLRTADGAHQSGDGPVIYAGHQGLHALAKRRQWRCIHCNRLTHCQECNPALDRKLAATRDHWQPKSKGGGNGPRNLVLSCFGCNQAKADRIPSSKLVPSVPKRQGSGRRKAA